MAVFRIREASRRLATLADVAESPALSVWLRTLGGQFEEQARRASMIVAAADDTEDVTETELDRETERQ
jgi:hypothetical protein